MKKPIEKSREELAAEGYVDTDSSDVKITTNVEVKKEIPLAQTAKRTTTKEILKPIPRESFTSRSITKTNSSPLRSDLETIESSTNKPRKKYARKKKATRKKGTRKKAVRRSRKTTVKEEKFIPPKILLKKNGYELIITEKPQAALKIASSLGKATARNLNKVPYYEVDRNGKKLIVACAVGHLFTLKQQTKGSDFPVFDIDWVPNYMARKKDFTKKYYSTLLSLAKNAGEITVATDFDIEGEVIGMNVVRFICNQKDANRMKFSTLTKEALNEAYDKKAKTLNWGQGIAGETRHYLDWYYGINLSRALMSAIKTTGKFKIMSIGRVQGPALKLIVDKEKEIQAFIPQTYWQVFIKVKQSRTSLELKYIKDIFDNSELSKFESLVGQLAVAKTNKSQNILPPNPPFNLTSLQTEAFKFHGIKPTATLRSAQSLYLAGLISYPRTSSEKLPKEIGYDKILKKVAKQFKAEKLIVKKIPTEGKKTDPAHPSIHPTGNFAILSGDEEKVYNLIAKRFIALFCDNAVIDKKRVTITTNDKLIFAANGSGIAKEGWLAIYPHKLKEVEIPDIEGEVEITDKRTEEKLTKAPNRFSPASILSGLEKKNLGTKATRANILETLYDRGYVTGTQIRATPFGISLIDTLEKHSPIIIDEKLTRDFEIEMEDIVTAKTNLQEKEDKVIDKAKETILKISAEFEKKEKLIGEELIAGRDKQIKEEREYNTLNVCPSCKTGSLKITYSPKTKRFFIACNAYPKCKQTYSLPPYGTIKKLEGKTCEKCGFPLLMSLQKGKKPWIFCFNRACETNASWVNKQKE
ncbi:DNA topoisomerase I [Candidatus Pacearchaeota archaeon]|nr:DNA topoisomerase I [Candidatus Pacearchaeota archaeon]